MFNELLRELERLGRGVKLSVNVPLDEEGYLDRQCPAQNCRAEFKVHDDDWTSKVTNTRAFCPICREEAPEVCGCRYASIGAAFFCLACGHNSVLSTFDQTIETVRKTMAGLPDIRAVLMASFDEDTAQNTFRDTVENNMGRLVGAFEHLTKALYEKLPATAKPPRKNVFQNVTDGSTLWRNSTGKGYEHFLSPAELDDLTRLFQQRHVLTHCQGIVDQEYLNKTGDHTYAVGRRLVIRDADVLRLADLVTKLSSGLRGIVP